MKQRILIVCLILSAMVVFGQKPYQRNSAEIELGLRKLNFLGSVLYVAAHPDDENTRLIAYLSNEMLANTAYLSMTRGDGGQNLIGPEIREYLGIIRTQELLAARRIDGGRQFFTRANDFGYSKSPEETQEIWERDEVLKDVVRTFRKFRPDVVITRFPTNGGGGHGHHTTSAILAHEAFRISGNKNILGGDLEELGTWAPKRLYLNTGRWWNQNIDENSPGVIAYDVGEYNPLLGSSYSEIAAVSRTQHKSQGFGSTGSRGMQIELLEHRLGEEASKDIFDGINTSWGRVKGGDKVQPLIDALIENYDATNPAESLPGLIEARKAIQTIGNEYWREIKREEVESLIKDCMGLYLEVRADDYSAVNGETIRVVVEATNRSKAPVFLNYVKVDGIADSLTKVNLNPGDRLQFTLSGEVPDELPISQPYWLRESGSLGMYKVTDEQLIGKPENDPAVEGLFELNILGESISYTTPLIYKWNDPVKGEQYRPFVITPPAYINIDNPVFVFADNESKEITLTVKAAKNGIAGDVSLDLPEGWKAEPEKLSVELKEKGEERRINFMITPPETESRGDMQARISMGDKLFQSALVEINYDHIPLQTVFPDARVQLVKIDLKKDGNLIGYIHGAGDDIPESLRNIGYEVWEMNDDDITPENLARMDAVVLGIRALNTRDRLQFVMKDLINYAEAGGTLVVQYNTTRGLKVTDFAPYPLELSRGRVSREEAEVRILAKDHPLIKGPNPISESDFDNWVQERGLYFPTSWDENYTSILSSNDPGESPLDGGLLVAKTGKGYYVYTGYSWFRQLPAGVPGAYKIFSNILSLGNGSVKSGEASLGKY